MRGINSSVECVRNVRDAPKILYKNVIDAQNILNNIFSVELHIIFNRGLMPLEPIKSLEKSLFKVTKRLKV